MRQNPDPLLQPLSGTDLRHLYRLIPFFLLLMLFWVGRAACTDQPLVNIESEEIRPTTFVVDINTATWPEIAQLPGIGEVLARRIVHYREEHGPFGSLDDVTAVHGVGEKLLQRGREYLLPIPPQQTRIPATVTSSPAPRAIAED